MFLLPTFCIAALALGGCTPAGAPKPAAKGAEKSAGVTISPPKKMRRIIEQPASIEPYEETPLVAQLSGYVKPVKTDIGQEVKAGAVLAEISVPQMLEELNQKSAFVKQTEAEAVQASAALDAADSHVQTAKAQVREAQSARIRAKANFERWQSENTRIQKLDKSVIDQQIRDETLNQYKAAEATREEVEAKVQSAEAIAKESEAKRDKAKADVQAAAARVLVAKADESRMKELVNYRFIRAPFDGIITKRSVDTGDYRQPNASGGPSALFVVARVDKLRIRAEIPETEAAFIKDDMKGEIRIPVLPGQSFEAKVSRTSKSLDPKLRTLRIEMDYPNKTPGKILRPGTFATVVFTVDVEDRFMLPQSALFTVDGQPYCYRIENGKAVRTPIKLGVRDGQFVEVVQKQVGSPPTWEHLTGQENIIWTNLAAVTEGKEPPIAGK
jgi:RND family efflux transporter MFP subunit